MRTSLLMLFAVFLVLLETGTTVAESLSTTPFIYPLLAPRVSSRFGSRVHPVRKFVRHHGGVDLAAPSGSHVRTVMGGVVVFAGVHGGYGKLVTVKHPGEKFSLYGHLSEIQVNVGQMVLPGQILGRVGQTGIATGPHLHFEWRIRGQSIDPLKVFPSLAKEAAG